MVGLRKVDLASVLLAASCASDPSGKRGLRRAESDAIALAITLALCTHRCAADAGRNTQTIVYCVQAAQTVCVCAQPALRCGAYVNST